jgi:hypothetical protein
MLPKDGLNRVFCEAESAIRCALDRPISSTVLAAVCAAAPQHVPDLRGNIQCCLTTTQSQDSTACTPAARNMYRMLRDECVRCRQPGGTQESLKPVAALSLVVFTAGLPASFLFALLRHRHAIVADQKLREVHAGDSPDTNPNFHIRTRFQELYRCVVPIVAVFAVTAAVQSSVLLPPRRDSTVHEGLGDTQCAPFCPGTVPPLCACPTLSWCSLFRPNMFYWRLVLMLRKFCEVAVALMFSSKPLFQAWYVHALRLAIATMSSQWGLFLLTVVLAATVPAAFQLE